MEIQGILTLALVNIPAMLIMVAISFNSYSISKKHRNQFCLVFLTITMIVALELLTFFVNGLDIRWRWVNIVSNYLGFTMIPLVPVFCAGAISDYRHSKWVLCLMAGYAIFMLFSVPCHLVYSVTSENMYYRCRYYWVFVTVYSLAVVHLGYVTCYFYRDYQNSSPLIFGLILGFLFLSTVVQILTPGRYLSWTCVSVIAILYYICCTELWLQVDELTGLLNHGAYLHRMKELPAECTLVLFDVDQFKEVNDGHGHLFGDACLRWVSKCIRSVYGSSGACYRVGGDEFAVIVRKKNFDPEEKYRQFQRLIRANRAARPGMPDVSLGWSVYHTGMSNQELIAKADQNMYENKHGKRSI